MPPPAFDTLTSRLRERLKYPLPGLQAQVTMAPSSRLPETRLSPPDDSFREAGVLATLFPAATGPAILLTQRRADLQHHPGQISFPGGRLEPGESHEQAALREAHEEIGLPPALVDVLGPLSPLYISVSNFRVHPFLGILPALPAGLKPQDTEVSQIIQVPLAQLTDPATRKQEPWTLQGHQVQVPYFAIDGHTIWGATAMMLAELVDLID